MSTVDFGNLSSRSRRMFHNEYATANLGQAIGSLESLSKGINRTDISALRDVCDPPRPHLGYENSPIC